MLLSFEMTLIEFIHDLEFAVLERREKQVSCLITSFQQGNEISDQITELKNIAVQLCRGEYVTALQQETPQHLLKTENATADLDQHIREKTSALLSSGEEINQSYVRHALVLFSGVACLELFLQYNWTGPPLQPSCDLSAVLPFYAGEGSEKEAFDQLVLARLNQDGEFLSNSVMDVPVLLLAAKVILVENEEAMSSCQSASLWALRCLAVQRQLLNENTDTMKNKIFKMMDKVLQSTILLSVEKNRFIASQIHLELGYLYLYYYETIKAREHFHTAQASLGLITNLTGALGKKTKFQQKDVSQLVLCVTRKENFDNTEGGSDEESGQSVLPKDVTLDDDTLLERIKFQDTDMPLRTEMTLTPLDQAVILGQCVEFQKSQAVHKLNKEELLTYLEVILSQPKMWCVRVVALLMRSRLEKNSIRRLERSMMQLQALVDTISSSSPKVSARHALFHCVPLPPRWTIQRELAKLLLEMGAVKSALEIFLKLQLWEDVVACYQSLGWYAKAEGLLREQLEMKETPVLWCVLGDTLKDGSCYEKAWELSRHRSSRAQRSLGYLHLRGKEYAKSIPCFQNSLELNSLQEGVWFSLGYAAMMTDDLALASKAFHRCVSLDGQNGQAWNNLANVFIKTKQKLRAHMALKEALKANYESWQTWENFLVVSVDVGGFNDAIGAYHRLMDLRDKYCDVEVLGILVKAVNQGIQDFKEKPASLVKPKLLKLMGRITSQVTNNSDVWKLYSDLYLAGDSKEEKEKALHFLVKAHRVRTQTPGWENDVSQFKGVIQLTLHLSEVYMEVSQAKEEIADSVQLLSSAKLNLKQLIARAKKLHTDSLTGDIKPELSDPVGGLETSLQRIVDLISTVKS